jgi:hypothetical protein
MADSIYNHPEFLFIIIFAKNFAASESFSGPDFVVVAAA